MIPALNLLLPGIESQIHVYQCSFPPGTKYDFYFEADNLRKGIIKHVFWYNINQTVLNIGESW